MENVKGHIYTIESAQSFTDELAAGIINLYGNNPLELADILIFLPTRRSVQALRDAFLRQANGKPLILPSISTIADNDEDIIAFYESMPPISQATGLGDNIMASNFVKILPAIDAQKRLLILTKLIYQSGGVDGHITPPSAMEMARALAAFLDMMQIEEVELSRLENICPDDHSNHWQIILQFLYILKDHWQDILSAEREMDIVAHRNIMLTKQADILCALSEQGQLKGDIIIAGSTGSQSATANFIKRILSLPEGKVILPALDNYANDENWQIIGTDPCHPQYGLYHLLDYLNISRQQVNLWQGNGVKNTSFNNHFSPRFKLLSHMMQSSKATDAWPKINDDLRQEFSAALKNVRRYDCPSEDIEARLIAFLMRKNLQDSEDRTIALVTPSRQLANKVIAEAKRWDISIDSSQGELLMHHSIVSFFKLITDVATSQWRPIKLLSLLKNPFSAAGLKTEECRKMVRLLETTLLRGTRPDKGIAGLRIGLTNIEREIKDKKRRGPPLSAEKIEKLKNFLTILDGALSPLCHLSADTKKPFKEFLHLHIETAENLAHTINDDGDIILGKDILWRHESGQALSSILSAYLSQNEYLENLSLSDYAGIFVKILEGAVLRKKYGTHPRIFIWGLLEARLQRADIMILGGLDEDIWPPSSPIDPWMSPLMRKQLGLPSNDRRIGLSAHDFTQALSGDEVILTRSLKRNGGSPTLPSRWLSRMQAFIEYHKIDCDLSLTSSNSSDSKKYIDNIFTILEALDYRKNLYLPIKKPEYCPPLTLRPTRLAITKIEKWLQDPYAIYAEKILRLYKLKDIEEQTDHALKGILFHQIIEEYIASDCRKNEKNINNRLTHFFDIANEVMRPYGYNILFTAIVWPRLQRMGEWFVIQDAEIQQNAIKTISEQQGEITIHAKGGDFSIYGYIDRIDIYNDDSVSIVDYKTGAPPRKKSIIEGKEPQLPIEAWMMTDGHILDKNHAVKEIAIWHISGKYGENGGGEINGGIIKPVLKNDKKNELDEAIENTQKIVMELIDIFQDESTAYISHPNPANKIDDRYNDYKYLERISEWQDSDSQNDDG